jgi:hypothetical protein
MSFGGEPGLAQDQLPLVVDHGQAVMQQVHEHLQVEMTWSQALQEQRANRGPILATNIQVGSNVWLDACNAQTTLLTQKLDCNMI